MPPTPPERVAAAALSCSRKRPADVGGGASQRLHIHHSHPNLPPFLHHQHHHSPSLISFATCHRTAAHTHTGSHMYAQQ